ncbi:hypothetical protein COBT_002388 [Conglomerata obtusa]
MKMKLYKLISNLIYIFLYQTRLILTAQDSKHKSKSCNYWAGLRSVDLTLSANIDGYPYNKCALECFDILKSYYETHKPPFNRIRMLAFLSQNIDVEVSLFPLVERLYLEENFVIENNTMPNFPTLKLKIQTGLVYNETVRILCTRFTFDMIIFLMCFKKFLMEMEKENIWYKFLSVLNAIFNYVQYDKYYFFIYSKVIEYINVNGGSNIADHNMLNDHFIEIIPLHEYPLFVYKILHSVMQSCFSRQTISEFNDGTIEKLLKHKLDRFIVLLPAAKNISDLQTDRQFATKEIKKRIDCVDLRVSQNEHFCFAALLKTILTFSKNYYKYPFHKLYFDVNCYMQFFICIDTYLLDYEKNKNMELGKRCHLFSQACLNLFYSSINYRYLCKKLIYDVKTYREKHTAKDGFTSTNFIKILNIHLLYDSKLSVKDVLAHFIKIKGSTSKYWTEEVIKNSVALAVQYHKLIIYCVYKYLTMFPSTYLRFNSFIDYRYRANDYDYNQNKTPIFNLNLNNTHQNILGVYRKISDELIKLVFNLLKQEDQVDSYFGFYSTFLNVCDVDELKIVKRKFLYKRMCSDHYFYPIENISEKYLPSEEDFKISILNLVYFKDYNNVLQYATNYDEKKLFEEINKQKQKKLLSRRCYASTFMGDIPNNQNETSVVTNMDVFTNQKIDDQNGVREKILNSSPYETKSYENVTYYTNDSEDSCQARTLDNIGCNGMSSFSKRRDKYLTPIDIKDIKLTAIKRFTQRKYTETDNIPLLGAEQTLKSNITPQICNCKKCTVNHTGCYNRFCIKPQIDATTNVIQEGYQDIEKHKTQSDAEFKINYLQNIQPSQYPAQNSACTQKNYNFNAYEGCKFYNNFPIQSKNQHGLNPTFTEEYCQICCDFYKATSLNVPVYSPSYNVPFLPPSNNGINFSNQPNLHNSPTNMYCCSKHQYSFRQTDNLHQNSLFNNQQQQCNMGTYPAQTYYHPIKTFETPLYPTNTHQNYDLTQINPYNTCLTYPNFANGQPCYNKDYISYGTKDNFYDNGNSYDKKFVNSKKSEISMKKIMKNKGLPKKKCDMHINENNSDLKAIKNQSLTENKGSGTISNAYTIPNCHDSPKCDVLNA